MKSMIDTLGWSTWKATPTSSIKEKIEDLDDQSLDQERAQQFKTTVGILMYYKKHRFDLYYVAKELAQSVSNPTELAWKKLKRAVRYVAATSGSWLEMVVPRDWPGEIVGWADASWADNAVTRASTSGGLIVLGNCTLCGWSKKQTLVAQSSAEAEFYALTTCAAESLFVSIVIRALGLPCKAVLKEDASTCIGMASRLGPGRVKHLEIKHLAPQQWLRSKRISVDKVKTDDQRADVLTKAFTAHVGNRLLPMIALILSERKE